MPWRTTAQSACPDGNPLEAQPKWRRDFPIDQMEDQHVSRRDFTRFMILTSGAFAVGQLWIAFQNFLRRGRGLPPKRLVASVGSVPLGGAMQFQYPGPQDRCVLVRTPENRFVAFRQACTHLSCAVQPEPSAGRFRCPCHEGYFDLLTGRPLSGPPQRPLPKIQIEVRGGNIYAVGVEIRT